MSMLRTLKGHTPLAEGVRTVYAKASSFQSSMSALLTSPGYKFFSASPACVHELLTLPSIKDDAGAPASVSADLQAK